MSIQEQIAEIVAKHNAILEANPLISELQWFVPNIPYKELNEFRCNQNENLNRDIEWSSVNDGCVYIGLHSWTIPGLPDKIYLRLSSSPVRVKTTVVEVVEDLTPNSK